MSEQTQHRIPEPSAAPDPVVPEAVVPEKD